jgi:5-formyltetrahydrofolate cyclo-ligase
MTIIEEKKRLRKQMLFERTTLDKQKKEEYDQWICQSIWEIICNHSFKNVHCYLPMGTEINISPLIEKMLNENIIVVTPKTLPKRELQNLILRSLNELEKGVFGTSHPANAKEFLGQYDLIIVPGLAFNDANFRLGYGGGYYDNFMAQYPEAYKLGICYSFQKVEHIPLETHDVKLDAILSRVI